MPAVNLQGRPYLALILFQDFGLQLVKKSADDQTLLMHAAQSADPMTFKAVADTCRRTCSPWIVSDLPS